MPICWTARPRKGHLSPDMGSELRDYAQISKLLLKHGPDPTVRCRLYWKDSEIEEVIHLLLARTCNAGSVIIDLLQEAVRQFQGEAGSASGTKVAPTRTHSVHENAICDICLGASSNSRCNSASPATCQQGHPARLGLAYKLNALIAQITYDACPKYRPNYKLFQDIAHGNPQYEG